jgi:REP element-mobilizing transposase RayT
MVIASHIIFTTYGFWLPNDPRGSWSDFVRNWELFWFGPATKTSDRKSLAHVDHDQARRQTTKSALKYDPVEFTGLQAWHVAKGFGKAVEESGYEVLACSILLSHIHAVVLRHENPAERIIGHLKARGTQELVAAGLHPFEKFRGDDGRSPSVWAHRGWKVFLNNREAISHAVGYVEQNPVKEGKPEQKWSFVTK